LNSQRPFHSRSTFPGRYTVEHVLFLDASNRMWPKIDESKGSHRASESTWAHPASTSPWPKDLLPSRLPKARIVTYGYDAYSLRLQQFVTTNRSRDQRSSERVDSTQGNILNLRSTIISVVQSQWLAVTQQSEAALL
jgi:hypothetical protein